MHNLKKIVLVVLSSITLLLNSYATIVETQKIIISNDFEVVSNAVFKGSITIGGETRTNWPAGEAPYQTYSATVSPDAGGTCTIAYANGSLVQIYQPATNITLSFNTATFTSTGGVTRVGVEIYSLTNSVALDYDTCTNAVTATNKSTTGWTTWFFRRTGNEIFEGRQ